MSGCRDCLLRLAVLQLCMVCKAVVSGTMRGLGAPARFGFWHSECVCLLLVLQVTFCQTCVWGCGSTFDLGHNHVYHRLSLGFGFFLVPGGPFCVYTSHCYLSISDKVPRLGFSQNDNGSGLDDPRLRGFWAQTQAPGLTSLLHCFCPSPILRGC